MFSRFCLLALATVGASCTHNVHVVDQDGNPIEGANVYPVTRSFRHDPVTTNRKGTVYVRQDLPPIEHIQATKPGYTSPPLTSYHLPKPITVVLTK